MVVFHSYFCRNHNSYSSGVSFFSKLLLMDGLLVVNGHLFREHGRHIIGDREHGNR